MRRERELGFNLPKQPEWIGQATLPPEKWQKWIREGMRNNDNTSSIYWGREVFDPIFAFPDFYKALSDNDLRQSFVHSVYDDATETLREIEKRLDLGEDGSGVATGINALGNHFEFLCLVQVRHLPENSVELAKRWQIFQDRLDEQYPEAPQSYDRIKRTGFLFRIKVDDAISEEEIERRLQDPVISRYALAYAVKRRPTTAYGRDLPLTVSSKTSVPIMETELEFLFKDKFRNRRPPQFFRQLHEALHNSNTALSEPIRNKIREIKEKLSASGQKG